MSPNLFRTSNYMRMLNNSLLEICSVCTVMASELASQPASQLTIDYRLLLACDFLVDSLVWIDCYNLVTASIYGEYLVKIVKFNVLQFKAKSAVYTQVTHRTTVL